MGVFTFRGTDSEINECGCLSNIIFTDKTFFCSDALKPKCVSAMRKHVNALAEVKTHTRAHDSQRLLLVVSVAFHSVHVPLDRIWQKRTGGRSFIFLEKCLKVKVFLLL